MFKRHLLIVLVVLFSVNCQLNFLEEQSQMNFEDYLLYINGFLNGTQLYKVAPNIVGCDNSDTGLYTSVVDFGFYWKNATWKGHSVLLIIEEVSASFSFMFGNFSRIFHYCKVAPYDTVDIFKALGSYLSTPLTYLGTVIKNLATSPYYIYKQYVKSKMLLERKQPYEAGQLIGEVFASTFFPKLDYTVSLFYLNSEVSEISEIEELFQCGISAVEITKNVVQSVREFVRIFRRTGTLTNLYSNLKAIIGEGSASVKACLKSAVRISKVLLKIIFDRK